MKSGSEGSLKSSSVYNEEKKKDQTFEESCEDNEQRKCHLHSKEHATIQSLLFSHPT